MLAAVSLLGAGAAGVKVEVPDHVASTLTPYLGQPGALDAIAQVAADVIGKDVAASRDYEAEYEPPAAKPNMGKLGLSILPERKHVDVSKLDAGNMPLTDLFTADGLEAAARSAACNEGMRVRLAAVHDLVAHTYILTLPRESKVHAAVDAAERLLSVGWPHEKTSLFIGADCKRLWGQPLADLSRRWHGGQTADPDLAHRSSVRGARIFADEDSEYSTCDLSKPNENPECFSACCALSHQLVMMHAFHFSHHPRDSHILILEEDVTFGPAAFAASTEALLRTLSTQPPDSWHMLKLGECETFTDDERALASPADHCPLMPDDPRHHVSYQAITQFSMYSSVANHGAIESWDPRTKRSYCSHSYMIHGSQAMRLVGAHFPIRANCDDQMNDSCESHEDANCLRLDKYVFNQDPTSGSSLASSCHPCNGEEQFTAKTKDTVKLESFTEPRPVLAPLLTGERPIVSGQSIDKKQAATWQPQDVNNMCGRYAELSAGKKLENFECRTAASAEECGSTCRGVLGCTSYVYHPVLPPTYNMSAYPTSQYFLCQQDPYTDLSEKMVISEWQGKCCLRKDDKWLPFIPPIWYYYDKTQPHVVSGTTMGDFSLAPAKVSPAAAADEAVEMEALQPVKAGLRVHMSDEIPDYLAASPHDEIDANPESAAAIRHANTVEYRQYGTVWAVARKQCQRKGLDLCPPTSYCQNGNRTRMTQALTKADWYNPENAPAPTNDDAKEAMWMPTLRACNSWVNLQTCEEPDGANPGSAPYLNALKYSEMQVGCCAVSEEATQSTAPQELRAEHERRAFLARPNNRNWVLNSLDDDAVRKQMAKRGKPAVLRIVVNHATSGLFASFQWVMLAMRFAKAAGLRTYVDHGPCTLCGYAPFTQDYSYHDWTAGPNAWSYFWEPTDTLSDLMAKPANSSVDVLTLDTHQIWNIFGTKPRFDIQSFQKGDFSGKGLWGPTLGVGGPVKFDAKWWAHQRARAWQLVGHAQSNKPIRFSKGFQKMEEAKWAKLLLKSAHHMSELQAKGERPKLIAAHMRGTDKQCGIGGPKIPVEQHFKLIDAFLDAHPGSLVFVATDAPSTGRIMRERYGSRLLLEDAVRSEKNALHEHGYHGEGYAFGKAAGAMLDSAHLSRADFLLCANSALGESAVWLNPKLADNMYNLQFPLKEQLKPHHGQVFGGGKRANMLMDWINNYAPPFCENKPMGK